jgi:uncharacterized repeat protein (TIGR04138 family)
MTNKNNFLEVVEEIVTKDPRYKVEAYDFVMSALNYTQSKLDKPRHVSGRELLEGIREYGLELFGLMTLTVFENWGVRRTEDFGNIVFNMLDAGLLSKTDEDSIEDFKAGYDFKEAFDKDYKY